LDGNGNGEAQDVAMGIIYAVDHGAKVIDVSLGGPAYSFTLETAVQYAEAHGVTVVAPAGNNNVDTTIPDNENYPAQFSSVISVGATGNAGDSNPPLRWTENVSGGSNY